MRDTETREMLEKPIIGYEGLYWINQNGDVRTIIRKGTRGDKRAVCTNRYGYKYVGLTKDGKRQNHTIHRLLAIHFIPNPAGHKYVNHKNGIKSDNRIENLEWCTSSHNSIHAYKTGLRKPRIHPVTMAKLTVGQVHEIRKRKQSGDSSAQIAKSFGVSPDTIRYIIAGRTWSHV